MLLAVICASKPWATPSLPVSKHCCWYPQQELTCRFTGQLQRVGSDHPRPSELSSCKFHFKLFGALTVVPKMVARVRFYCSKFHATSFDPVPNPIPNPILKPIPKLKKRKNIFRFIDLK